MYMHITIFFTVCVGITIVEYECDFCTSKSDWSETLFGIKNNKNTVCIRCTYVERCGLKLRNIYKYYET